MNRRASLVLLLPLVAGCLRPQQQQQGPADASVAPPPVVLMTDFGLRDDAVGLLRGVVLRIAPSAQVVDLTHAVQPYDIEQGARLLLEAPGIYPARSVFVVVVDPGVGTRRRPIAARLASGTILVGPDNGVLAPAIERWGPAEVRALDNPGWRLGEVSTTFHGRDVFAPAGGHLAAGEAFAKAGPVVDDWVRLRLPTAARTGEAIQGQVVAIDEPFGNVWTNVDPAQLEELGVKRGGTVSVEVSGASAPVALTVRWVDTFGDVAEGQPLLYVHSRGQVALAINMGDFARAHGVARGAAVTLRAPAAGSR